MGRGGALRKGQCYSGEVPEEPLARPEYGARLLAKLVSGPPGDAAYALELATPAGTCGGTAAVRESDGQVEQSAWSGELVPPSWLVQAAHALVRSAWQRRRAGNAWPRRLSRWRPAPGEPEQA